MREAYDRWLAELGDPVFFTVSSFILYVVFFWGHHAVLHLVVYSGRVSALQKYKVHKHVPDPTLVTKALLSELLGAILQLPVIFFTYKHCLAGRMTLAWAEVPGLVETTTYVVAWHVIFDTWFYWGHRLLHHPSVYWIHKQHHSFHATVGIAATFSHPIEGVLTGLGSTFAGPFLFPAHITVWWLYFVLRLYETVDAHCGYDWPWSLWAWCPLHGGCRRHDFHHSHNKGNYGGFLVWDWLCGTDEAYRKFCAKVE